jgi:hypothetical protein
VLKLATAVNLAVHTPVCLPASGKDFTGRLTFFIFFIFSLQTGLPRLSFILA